MPIKRTIIEFYIDADDSTDESAEDITAAETAPIPMNETTFGVKYWKTSGTTLTVKVLTIKFT